MGEDLAIHENCGKDEVDVFFLNVSFALDFLIHRFEELSFLPAAEFEIGRAGAVSFLVFH